MRQAGCRNRDVRDVADAHYNAGYNPEAKAGISHLLTILTFLKWVMVLLPKYGDKYPLPKKALPKWLLMVVGPMVNKLFSRRFIRNNVNIPWNADNSKIKKELGIHFRPMKETMEDSFQQLIDEGTLPKK